MMKNKYLLDIKNILPIATFVCSLLGIYMVFFSNITWIDVIVQHPFLRLLISFVIIVFRFLVSIVFFSNFIIAIHGILSHKNLLSRMWLHVTISVVTMLVLSFIVLLVLVFFVPKTYQELLLTQTIAEKSVVHEFAIEDGNISETLDRVANEDIVNEVIDSKVLKKLYKNNNINYSPYLLFILTCIIFVVFFLLVCFSIFVKKSKNKNSHKNIKTILDSFIHNVQFGAISSFKAIEYILQWMPLWIVLFLPYMLKIVMDKNIAYSLSQYILIYHLLGVCFMLINGILIFIRVKCSVKTIIHTFLYPMFVSFSSGNSIVSMYSSIYNTAKYFRENPFGIKSFMPWYFFFARMGNVIYFTFMIFIFSHIFSLSLFSLDFILLSCFATLFSFIPTADDSTLLFFILGILLFLFGIPLQSAMIIIFGIDILFKPMRSALTTNFAITIMALFEYKYEKSHY